MKKDNNKISLATEIIKRLKNRISILRIINIILLITLIVLIIFLWGWK